MKSLSDEFKFIMQKTWPVIIFICVISIIFRIMSLLKNKKRFVFHEEVSYLLALVYILCLFQVVTSQDVEGVHGVNITLFEEMTRYQIGSNLFYRNIIGNIVLFTPFGFLLGHIFKINKYWQVTILTLLTSLLIETIQLSIGRAFDVDDIVLNIIGGLLGYLVYRLLSKVFEKYNHKVKDIVLTIFLIIAFMGIIMIIM